MEFNPQKDKMILAHLTQRSDNMEEKVKIWLVDALKEETS